LLVRREQVKRKYQQGHKVVKSARIKIGKIQAEIKIYEGEIGTLNGVFCPLLA
jgi:hypothetical protein